MSVYVKLYTYGNSKYNKSITIYGLTGRQVYDRIKKAFKKYTTKKPGTKNKKRIIRHHNIIPDDKVRKIHKSIVSGMGDLKW